MRMPARGTVAGARWLPAGPIPVMILVMIKRAKKDGCMPRHAPADVRILLYYFPGLFVFEVSLNLACSLKLGISD